MFSTRKLIAGTAAAAALFVGTGAGVAAATAPDAPSLSETTTTVVDTDVDAPQDHLVVFSADARINGQRVQEEWYFAFGVNERWPHVGSLWLMTDAETDEWIPLCLGYVVGDEEGVLFLGESLHGDPDEGCAMVGLGDEGDVFFGAIELEGDEILTAAMYPVG